MKTLSAVLMMGCVLLFAAPAARADGCDDIGRLSERWQKLSTYIDEHSDDGKLRKAEIKKVSAETKTLVPPTREFGNALVKDFKGTEEQRIRALGKQIIGALDELGGLSEDDDWDEDVKIIDRLVEILEKLTDICKQ